MALAAGEPVSAGLPIHPERRTADNFYKVANKNSNRGSANRTTAHQQSGQGGVIMAPAKRALSLASGVHGRPAAQRPTQGRYNNEMASQGAVGR